MNLKFRYKEITGILSILPVKEIRFEDEIGNYNFPPAKSLKLQKVMGFGKRRVVAEGTTISDLCVHGLNHLFTTGALKKEDIDALILVSQSSDYIMPATSNIIHGRLEMKQDMICLDINQGCAGFIVGLIEAFLLLEQDTINKVVVLNADVLSMKVSKQDRNSNPLIGDGASVTVVEKSRQKDKHTTIFANIKTDGSAADALMIPAGGFKTPSSAETAKMVEDENGNFRSLDNLVMKGDLVFNFVQREVPPMITDLLQFAGESVSDIDYFMFHQPNKFMLQKLADKMEVGYEKMPNNVVENFGNGSGVTIPTAITFNAAEQLKQGSHKVCLAGFGVGLTWTSMLIELGKLDFCEIIYY